jgi:hypothetical protein
MPDVLLLFLHAIFCFWCGVKAGRVGYTKKLAIQSPL